jgi:hypothetical protein
VVRGKLDARRCRVAEQICSRMFGFAEKPGVPAAAGAIDSFKAFFGTSLDFVLPQDYNHRCPISCSDVGNPVRYSPGEDCVTVERSNPIGYKPRWVRLSAQNS